MKVTLIYGREGSGKSSLIHKLSRVKRENNSKIIYIVPDQYTHQTELDIIAAYDTNGLIDTDVLSFKRLSHRLKILYGGACIIAISDEGKSMLINGIIKKLSDDDPNSLKCLSEEFVKTNISLDIAKLISRFKQYNITPEMLEDCNIDSVKFAHTNEKLAEIAKIYREYIGISETVNNAGFMDEEDDISLLCKNIVESSYFENTDIFIDGFDDFAKHEFNIVETLVKHSKSVTISLPVDYVSDAQRRLMTKRQDAMAASVEHMLSENKILPERIWLTDEIGTSFPDVNIMLKSENKKNGISFLERNIFKVGKIDKCTNSEGIVFVNEINDISECEHMADEIVRAVRDKGFRYNEIAVVCGNIESYKKKIETAFQKRNIPFFMDIKRSISDNAIIRFVLGLFTLVLKKKNVYSIISWLKTGILINTDEENDSLFTYDEISYIEKYCTQYFVYGNKWENDFTYGEKYFDIEKLNNIRKKILYYVKPFETSINKAETAEDIANVIENYFSDMKIYDIIQNKIAYFQKNGINDTALEYSNIINVLNEILAEISTFLTDTKFNISDFLDILSNRFEKATVNVIPVCIDEVSVLEAGRTMAQHIKELFVLGANNISVGEESSIFNMNELNILREHNIDIGIDSQKVLADEEYYIYKILSKPTEYIYISTVQNKGSDDDSSNPILINAVKSIFKESLHEVKNSFVPYKLSDIDNLGSAVSAMLYEITTLNKKSENYYKLDEWLKVNNIGNYSMLAGITEKGKNYELTTEKINSEYIVKREGGEYTIDISRLEQYMKCPYAYYVKYCLKPQRDNNSKVSSLDIGNLVHKLLEVFVNTVSHEKNIEVDVFMENNFEKVASEYETGKFSLMNENKYILHRIRIFMKNMFEVMLKRSYFSSTIIFATELIFDDKKTGKYILPAIEANTPDNEVFKIRGKIDYVEYCETSQGRYWIINDYKTGNNPSNADIFKHRSIQLPIYMYAILKNDENSIPGAMFYINVNDKILDLKNNNITDLNEKRFGKVGIVSSSDELYKAIDNTCIKTKKTKSDSGDYDIKLSKTIADASKLSKMMSEEIVELSNDAVKYAGEIFSDIKNGFIVKAPLSKKECTYCEYRRFCGYDSKLKNLDERIAQIKEDLDEDTED